MHHNYMFNQYPITPKMTPTKAAHILQCHNDWRRGLIDEDPYRTAAVIEAIETYAPNNEILTAYVEAIRGHGSFRFEAGQLGREIDTVIKTILE